LKATPVIGKYTIYNADNKIADVLKNETAEFRIVGEFGVQVFKNGSVLGVFSTVTLSGAGLINEVKIKPVNPDLKERTYDDDFRVSVVNGSFLVINHVDVENYVAGVVQSEGGGSVKDNEFYIVQAICCRTYALNNMKKHSKEGFNLCDSIHCQLYMGHCQSSDILLAVYRTAGDVIVDTTKRMISAAFHSNSGGETANSEDVWSIPTTYLKSVADTFSLGMPDAKWEKTVLASDWLNFLKNKYNFPVNDSVKRKAALNFQQPHRKIYFVDSIKLTAIRTELGLKSTWFSLRQVGNNVVFSGKGYGHGVGMSQEGAIRMSKLGYSYKEIIRYYYKDVEIMSYEQLMIKN
jgi:stage II sporulation protein D